MKPVATTYIKKAVTEYMQEVPRRALQRVLATKMSEAGRVVSDVVIEALAKHILSGNQGTFSWDDGQDEEKQPLNITFTPEDCLAIEAEFDRVVAAIPDAVLGATKAAGNKLFGILKGRWGDEYTAQLFELDRFRDRIEMRWGEGLAYLRMLLTCCREAGRTTAARHHKSKAKGQRFRRGVMVRLHIRACQVSDEVICLMENGFADGAMARWRTLHELSIVAMLIDAGDEELAERYMLHDIVEVKRQADEYDATNAILGEALLGKRRRAQIDRSYSAAIARFGPTYAHPYGWASSYLHKKKPTFKDLQTAANRAGMNGYYKLASFNVHASARSLFFNLGSMSNPSAMIAGRSNAGLADPGQQAAHTLLLITDLLCGRPDDLDYSINTHCLIKIRDSAVDSLWRASRLLQREEIERQMDLSRRRLRRRTSSNGSGS